MSDKIKDHWCLLTHATRKASKLAKNNLRYQTLYMYKEDLALNNLQALICHKTQPNQIIYI